MNTWSIIEGILAFLGFLFVLERMGKDKKAIGYMVKLPDGSEVLVKKEDLRLVTSEDATRALQEQFKA